MAAGARTNERRVGARPQPKPSAHAGTFHEAPTYALSSCTSPQSRIVQYLVPTLLF